MEQQEPVDFDTFLRGVSQDSADDRRTASEALRGPGEPLDLAAALSAEETATQSRINPFWTKDPPISWRYRDRTLRDWRAASIPSRQFRAMGKFAFFKMKTFLFTAETAALLQRSMLRQLSRQDQKMAAERIRSIVFPIAVERIHISCLPLPTRIKGFPSLTSVCFAVHGRLDNTDLKEKGVICREIPSEFQNVMSQFGIPTSRPEISLEIHRTAGIVTWRDMEGRLSREVYPLLRTRARLLRLG